MKQSSCKRLSVLLVNLCILISIVKAQDSTKTITPPQSTTKTVTKTPPKPVPPAPKTVKPLSKPVQPTTKAAPQPVTTITNPPQPVDSSLKGQYEDLLKHSWLQQGYKVVNPGRLTNLWKSVNDTLTSNKRQLAEARQKLTEQARQIEELQSQPSSKSSSEKPTVLVSEIQVLGMTVDASTYHWIVWGLILVLILALAAIIFTTTKGSYDSKQQKQLYEEVSAEFQAYKAKTKEKELKLARELQTERNTIEELLAKRNDEEDGKRSKK